MLAAGVLASSVAATPLVAQEQNRPWSLRDLLFPQRRIQRIEPAPPVQRVAPPEAAQPKAKPRAKTVRQKKAAPAPPVTEAPDVVETPKAADAKVVLVVGDFVGASVAEGIVAMFATDPRVRVVDRTNGSSGFVRADHYDWIDRIDDLIAAEKPAAVVMAIGANDRQTMRIGDRREPVRSNAWSREYLARAATFASMVVADDVPLVWVGTPPFKSARANSDMLALNEIFRKTADDSGGEFVDVWDGFVDEAGTFVTTGPDIAGQPVRLRASDGINLTDAGKRKLAFYAEKPLRRLLGLDQAPDPTAPALPIPGAGTPIAAKGAPTDRTEPISLADPRLDGGDELLDVPSTASLAAPAMPTLDAAATPGRADDFAWPRRSATASIARNPTATAGQPEKPVMATR